eukprot:SAG11_NODE_19619_length_462_cov_2.826446_1_plen_89_part_00
MWGTLLDANSTTASLSSKFLKSLSKIIKSACGWPRRTGADLAVLHEIYIDTSRIFRIKSTLISVTQAYILPRNFASPYYPARLGSANR